MYYHHYRFAYLNCFQQYYATLESVKPHKLFIKHNKIVVTRTWILFIIPLNERNIIVPLAKRKTNIWSLFPKLLLRNLKSTFIGKLITDQEVYFIQIQVKLDLNSNNYCRFFRLFNAWTQFLLIHFEILLFWQLMLTVTIFFDLFFTQFTEVLFSMTRVLRLSRRWYFKSKSSGLWRRVVLW